jgi:hypothetical protein
LGKKIAYKKGPVNEIVTRYFATATIAITAITTAIVTVTVIVVATIITTTVANAVANSKNVVSEKLLVPV